MVNHIHWQCLSAIFCNRIRIVASRNWIGWKNRIQKRLGNQLFAVWIKIANLFVWMEIRWNERKNRCGSNRNNKKSTFHIRYSVYSIAAPCRIHTYVVRITNNGCLLLSLTRITSSRCRHHPSWEGLERAMRQCGNGFSLLNGKSLTSPSHDEFVWRGWPFPLSHSSQRGRSHRYVSSFNGKITI